MTSLSMRPYTTSDAVSLMHGNVNSGMTSSIDEIADRLAAMQYQESTTYRRVDYLSCSRRDNGSKLGDDFQAQHRSARSKMCTWCHQLTDISQLSRLSVSRAMNYLDQFMASSHGRARQALFDRRQYQLASMTCLYIAIKLHEPLSMEASLLAEISAGTYMTEDIVDMEKSILESLHWKMNGPTSQEFLCLLLGLLNPRGYNYDVETIGSLFDVSMFQCELATGDYDLSLNCDPSVVALASILNSLEGTNEATLSSKERYLFLTKACGMIMPHDGINLEFVYVVQARLRRLCCHNSGFGISLPSKVEESQEMPRKASKAQQTSPKKNDVMVALSPYDKLNWSSPVSVISSRCPRQERQSFAKCA